MKVLKNHGWDAFLAVITFFGGNALAVFTLVRCRNRWQFILIAVWKICLSTTLAMSALTNSIYLPDKEDQHIGKIEVTPSILWGILYVLGLIVGMVGLASLAKETWHSNSRVRLITYVFGGVTGGLVAFLLIGALVKCCDDDSEDVGEIFAGIWIIAIGLFIVFGLFYSDWILAAIAGNLSGFPSGDIAVLYWLYFVAKRLPMLSF